MYSRTESICTVQQFLEVQLRVHIQQYEELLYNMWEGLCCNIESTCAAVREFVCSSPQGALIHTRTYIYQDGEFNSFTGVEVQLV